MANPPPPSPPKTLPESRWTVSRETLLDTTEAQWSGLGGWEKVDHVVWVLVKLASLFLILFLFVATLALLADAFELLGARGIGHVVRHSAVIQNPISASILGMVTTLILQSGSTLISLLVGMVAGGLVTVHQAIPIMLGSEMGASFMNALVALGQVGDRDQFRRAFAAATMNDIFNFLCYFVVLPIEIAFGIIEFTSGLLVEPLARAKGHRFKTLNALTDPLLERIIQIDSEAINAAVNHHETRFHSSYTLSTPTGEASEAAQPSTFIFRCRDLNTGEVRVFCPYEHLFAESALSDTTIGVLLLVVSILLLITSLVAIVKLTQALLAGRVALLVREMMDRECPRPFRWLTNYVLMLIGCAVVMVVQSSGVFRSALTPLVGIGVIRLEKLYPLLLGANVGTTFTGVLAALSADPARLKETMQIALAQTIYNLIGIVLFYPLPPLRRIPVVLAMKLGDKTAKYKWFSLVYIALVFFVMPACLLALSFLPTPWVISVVGALVTFFGAVALINFCQVNCPRVLPRALRDWSSLPIHLHSLHRYDAIMSHYCGMIPLCGKRFRRSPTPSLEEPSGSEGQSEITASATESIRGDVDQMVQRWKAYSQQTPV